MKFFSLKLLLLHAWKETCCCSRSDILFLARTARAPLRRATHAFIGETKEMHPRKAQVCTKTFINTVPGFGRSMCHPTFQYIFFHFSIQACHRLWNLSVEPFNQSLNTESMGFLRGTLLSTLFHIQPFAPTSMLSEQIRNLPSFGAVLIAWMLKLGQEVPPWPQQSKEQREGCQRPSQGQPNQHKKDHQKQLHDHLGSFQTSRWLHIKSQAMKTHGK